MTSSFREMLQRPATVNSAVCVQCGGGCRELVEDFYATKCSRIDPVFPESHRRLSFRGDL